MNVLVLHRSGVNLAAHFRIRLVWHAIVNRVGFRQDTTAVRRGGSASHQVDGEFIALFRALP